MKMESSMQWVYFIQLRSAVRKVLHNVLGTSVPEQSSLLITTSLPPSICLCIKDAVLVFQLSPAAKGPSARISL
jgi:hypothetical protein